MRYWKAEQKVNKAIKCQTKAIKSIIIIHSTLKIIDESFRVIISQVFNEISS